MTLRVAALCALVLATGACGPRPPSAGERPDAEPLVWPGPPAEPRIRYVMSLSSPPDVGVEKSFFGRVTDALFGRAEEFLIRPTGVAEHEGVLYVADPGAQAVWIFDTVNRKFAKVAKIGPTALISPVAVAPASDGAVFVADTWLKIVVMLARDGRFLRPVATEGLERPAALAYDAQSDRLYVADSAAHRVVVYRADGTRVFGWGTRGSGDGEFNYPTHLALDRLGTLLVTDALNFRVQAFDRDGHFLWRMGEHGDGSGNVASPKGVAADNIGHLYLVDALYDAVQIFDRDRGFLLSFGGRGVKPGEFWLPSGIFVNGRDRIYVADSYNQRVQVFELLPAAD